MTSKIVVNNIESDAGISSVTFNSNIQIGAGTTIHSSGIDLGSGNITGGIVTATSFTGSGANLSSLPAANLTGTLPAISGANLTGINTAFGSGTSVNTTGIITATAFVPTQGQLSNRNIIINGAMQVAQRAASASGSFTTAAYPTCDRWQFAAYNTDQLSMTITQEAMNSVNGFGKYLKMSPGTAESGGAANEYVNMRYIIEAQDCQQLEWGTLSAKSATLSFWVKSTVTGTACVNFTKNDSTSYQITRTYTINVANTWEYKTLTIPGLTASGIANDNGEGITIYWFFDAGSSYKSSNSTSWGTLSDGGFAYGHSANFIDSTSTNWNITGVQFEVGPVATPFEHRSFAQELQLCKRYFNMYSRTHADSGNEAFIANGFFWSNSRFMAPLRFDVPMRTNSWSLYKVVGSDYFRIYNDGGGNHQVNDFGLNGQAHVQSAHLNITDATSSGEAGMFFCRDSAARIGFDAEL